MRACSLSSEYGLEPASTTALKTPLNHGPFMQHMNKIDHLALDGHTLKTFLTVLEENSVSRAADRLAISQSAVSHTLEKLRKIFQDPLFVRVGRGIEPTAKARALQTPVEAVLEQLKSLTREREFDPLTEKMDFTVATNDFPLQLIFPRLLREISGEGIDLKIRFIPAGIPRASAVSWSDAVARIATPKRV